MIKKSFLLLFTAFFLCAYNTSNYQSNILFSCRNTENVKQSVRNYISYPKYREIITKFYHTYSVKDRPNHLSVEDEFLFHKKPDGWHVVVFDYLAENKIIKDEILWDSKNREYMDLSFEKVKNKNENLEYLNSYKYLFQDRYYDIPPYYGYIGWDKDVINDFKSFEYKNDSLLYGIGRAYSSYSTNLLNNNTGLADSSSMFELPDKKNCLSQEQLDEYRFYKHKAIEYFDTLAKRNPDFTTIVGPIGIKASNERVVAYLDLQVYQNDEEAKKELIDGLYDPFTIAAAKNFLNSCEKNAILFTYGDNDTYPLLYVQEYIGIRKDVSVVNIQLLNTYRYINNFRDNQNDLRNLPFTFKKEDFKGNKRIYGLLRPSDKYDALYNFIDFVKDDNNINKTESKGFFEFHSNLFSIERDIEDEMKIEISKNYILRNELIILDILQNEDRKRPIYFSISVSGDIHDFFGEYLQSEGLVNKLVYEKVSNMNSMIGFFNPDHLKQILFEKYDWSGTNSKKHKLNNYARFYRSLFQNLADSYISKNDFLNAEEIQDKSLELFHDDIFKYGIEMYSCINNYYLMNKISKGNAVAKILIKNLKEEEDKGNQHFDKDRYQEEKEMQMTMVKELLERYDQTELLDLF